MKLNIFTLFDSFAYKFSYLGEQLDTVGNILQNTQE
jgi:hypothetical protein